MLERAATLQDADLRLLDLSVATIQTEGRVIEIHDLCRWEARAEETGEKPRMSLIPSNVPRVFTISQITDFNRVCCPSKKFIVYRVLVGPSGPIKLLIKQTLHTATRVIQFMAKLAHHILFRFSGQLFFPRCSARD